MSYYFYIKTPHFISNVSVMKCRVNNDSTYHTFSGHRKSVLFSNSVTKLNSKKIRHNIMIVFTPHGTYKVRKSV